MTDEYDPFFDAEPEDAWHPDDEVDEQVGNLVRRAKLLDLDNVLIPGGNAIVTLDAVVEIVRRARRGALTERGRVRAELIDEDVVFVRGRL